MGKIKKLIQEANTPKKVETLLGICLLRMAEFLNTSNIHAAIDYSGYWINGKFYTNKDMVQEFIYEYGNKKSEPEKADDGSWLLLDKPFPKVKEKKGKKPELGMNVKAMKSSPSNNKGKRGRPKKVA
jgi:hypothetical protein